MSIRIYLHFSHNFFCNLFLCLKILIIDSCKTHLSPRHPQPVDSRQKICLIRGAILYQNGCLFPNCSNSCKTSRIIQNLHHIFLYSLKKNDRNICKHLKCMYLNFKLKQRDIKKVGSVELYLLFVINAFLQNFCETHMISG